MAFMSILPITVVPSTKAGKPFMISLVSSFNLSGPTICSNVPAMAAIKASIITGKYLLLYSNSLTIVALKFFDFSTGTPMEPFPM
ncbi:hypothetical protein DSECCO2_374820 [anaerobic digester metagenome]